MKILTNNYTKADTSNLDPKELATEMCIIVANNDISRVRLLIDAGFPLSIGDYDGRTPLHIAASFGYKNLAKYLTDAGADT